VPLEEEEEAEEEEEEKKKKKKKKYRLMPNGYYTYHQVLRSEPCILLTRRIYCVFLMRPTVNSD
jgi:hypothetical protein